MKLYIYGSCTICLGTGKTWYDRGCPYCNNDAKQYFEASAVSVMRYTLEDLDETSQHELFTILKEKFEGEEND